MTIAAWRVKATRCGTPGSETVRLQVPDTGWHQVTARYVAVQSGGTIDLNVLVYDLQRGQSFRCSLSARASDSGSSP